MHLGDFKRFQVAFKLSQKPSAGSGGLVPLRSFPRRTLHNFHFCIEILLRSIYLSVMIADNFVYNIRMINRDFYSSI